MVVDRPPTETDLTKRKSLVRASEKGPVEGELFTNGMTAQEAAKICRSMLKGSGVLREDQAGGVGRVDLFKAPFAAKSNTINQGGLLLRQGDLCKFARRVRACDRAVQG